MVTLTDNSPEDHIMTVDDYNVYDNRRTCPEARQRLREERRRTIKLLEEKYAALDDHEKNPRRFVLIRNNLRRLQREAREEKLARHRSSNDFSFMRSPFTDDISSALTPFQNDEPPSKRQRLFSDDTDNDKENEHHGADKRSDVEMKDSINTPESGSFNAMDDAQEILRDLYEACTPDVVPPRPLTPAAQKSSDCSTTTTSNSTSSLSFSVSTSLSNTSNSSSYSCSSSDLDWNWQSPYHYHCGYSSSMRGNDLQSVVFHSLIASLES